MTKLAHITVYRNHLSKAIYFLKSEGYTWKQIGEVLGISAPAALQLVKNNLGREPKI